MSFVLSLIAQPGALSAAHLTTFDAEGWRWLAPGEAAEVSLDALPPSFDAQRQALSDAGVDANVVPAEGRRKALLIADMDSTMIHQECIDEMAAHAGIGEQVAQITALAMDGKLEFEAAMAERVALVKGLPVAALQTVFDERITLMEGGATLLATMGAHGTFRALVSGGFTFFTERVAQVLGFDEHRANVLLTEGGVLTGDVARPILGRDAKVTALEELTARLGISETAALAVGDGANDLGMLGRAGLGVALHAKPSVQAQCPVRVNHGDLTALLFLQGYAKSDFVTP
ncbi:MAG: phosphoserine phosphatase SerB [Pseudomonadota bacterium]